MKAVVLTISKTDDGRLKVLNGKCPVAIQQKDGTVWLSDRRNEWKAPACVAEWLKAVPDSPDGF